MSQTLEVALFLSMNGKAREAIAFYQHHLDAELHLLVTYGDMEGRDATLRVAEENRNKVSHSVLTIGKSKVMIAEEPMDPGEPCNAGNQMSLCIQSADLDEIRSFYTRLITDERVRVITPLAPNIFSEAYGIVQDPFGVYIQLMYDKRLAK
jgi:PhnB protein